MKNKKILIIVTIFLSSFFLLFLIRPYLVEFVKNRKIEKRIEREEIIIKDKSFKIKDIIEKDLKVKDSFIELYNKDKVKSKEAIYSWNGKDIVLEKESSLGEEIEKEILEKEIKKVLLEEKDRINFDNIIKKPKDFKKDIEEDLKKLKEEKLILKVKNIEEILSFEEKLKMIELKDNKITFNEEKVLNFIKDFDKKVRTYNKPFKFKTTEKGERIIDNNNAFGWDILWDKSKEELLKALKERTSKEVNLIVDKDLPEELEEDYVEVDLEEQKLYFYKNKEKVLETPIVSGKPDKRTFTRKGAFRVYAKELNKTLRGNNVDGSRYATFVKYWMPFDGGIGIHDSSWRREYKKDSYINNGSHGCVNTPPKEVEKLWDLIEKGTVVIIY